MRTRRTRKKRSEMDFSFKCSVCDETSYSGFDTLGEMMCDKCKVSHPNMTVKNIGEVNESKQDWLASQVVLIEPNPKHTQKLIADTMREMERPAFTEIYMNLALDLARRSTCRRLKVGCVIVSEDYQKVLAIGYNGNAAGFPNDCDSDEAGKCGCIHAEENAMIKCTAPHSNKIVFTTHQPCAMCAKKLVNLGRIKHVYYKEPYRLIQGLEILKEAGIEVSRIGERHDKSGAKLF